MSLRLYLTVQLLVILLENKPTTNHPRLGERDGLQTGRLKPNLRTFTISGTCTTKCLNSYILTSHVAL